MVSTELPWEKFALVKFPPRWIPMRKIIPEENSRVENSPVFFSQIIFV